LETLKERRTPVEGVDFYREGAYVVFTEQYHLRRGYCCESGCRHCPYGAEPGHDVLHEKDRERNEE
jgi:hypothetical protein